MAKANTYIFTGTDTEGEFIYESERLTAMTDKAAWAEALKRCFLEVSRKQRQGILCGRLEVLTVGRV